MRIAYVGFVQRGSIRFYHFDGIVDRRPGQIARHTRLSMTADMAVVRRLRVKYQDLPGLCMRTLSAAIESCAENDGAPASYALTEADVHTLSIAAEAAKTKRPKRH